MKANYTMTLTIRFKSDSDTDEVERWRYYIGAVVGTLLRTTVHLGRVSRIGVARKDVRTVR